MQKVRWDSGWLSRYDEMFGTAMIFDAVCANMMLRNEKQQSALQMNIPSIRASIFRDISTGGFGYWSYFERRSAMVMVIRKGPHRPQ